MPQSESPPTAGLWDAERLMRARDFASAAEILEDIVEHDDNLQALCMLASSLLEVGEHRQALHYASLAAQREPSLAPARDLLGRANAALGHFASALSEYRALAALCREQSPAPPDEFSIPAHFALHNIEQIAHILAAEDSEKRAFAGVATDELPALRRQLTDLIDASDGAAPWVSVQGKNGRILADPPYVRASEERLPRYLNPGIDYAKLQNAIVADRRRVQVIDEFLTPAALAQVRKFCLQSTVWRHSYEYGYIGAFPQDGFASVSLFAIAEELLAALGEALDGYYFAQWWGFVYNANLPGVDVHADDSDFAVNLWITPDSANLDPSRGGLVVWDKTAPSDWTFEDYNAGGTRVRRFLEQQSAKPNIVPHRENRAVLFGEHLFHQTDEFTFAPGFANRRRSLTFLFRRRKQ
ncbi:hypothetical protein MSAS_06670 [Mycobacterium saskatchewanense]|uniref:Tetratricopeptide repeat protein n=1 Tax=Mycobacterium saskatchewanense TaxID=220927 RepID=A0AAJ3NMU3_9MYCO|nr:BTAD domain-containing putative transcriptional regulator [Mycobacterium saskatchewanense]ORW70052.1 hypothetical protein AWC23_17815 [Mycobacterium saskatchewanense]BBX61493.1 hypothetical protein MSAS_06670 [Mycobacterium saskatchewanense]